MTQNQVSGKVRVAAVALAVSVSGVAGWKVKEGFSPTPIQPVQGDRWTIGHGMTFYPDGTPVRQGDRAITRDEAGKMITQMLDAQYGECVRKSLGNARVSQDEFDIAVDFAGQYGCAAWAASTQAAMYKAARYGPACEAYLQYRLFHTRQRPKAMVGWTALPDGRYRYDCSTPGNKVCAGVWTRSVGRFEKCSA